MRKAFLLFSFRLLMVCMITPLGYALMQAAGRMPFGEIWQWSLTTILVYLGFTIHILRGANLYRLGTSVLTGYVLSIIVPDPAGAVLFSIAYGGIFAVAAHWSTEQGYL